MSPSPEEEQLEVTDEIRALLRLLVKQHVRSWYTGLSQDEQLFTEFESISAHVQTTLAARVQVVDWQVYLNKTLPELILRHLQDYNIAVERLRSDYSIESAFLSLQTHQGVQEQESHLMHVADALLIVLLPEHDLMSEVAYTMTREVLSDLVLRAVVERISEPWFWDELLLKLYGQTASLISQERQNIGVRARDLLRSTKRSVLNSLTQLRPASKSHKAVPVVATKSKTGLWLYLQHPAETYKTFVKQLEERQSIYDTALPAILFELAKPSRLPFSKALAFSVVLPLTDISLGEELTKRITRFTQEIVSHNSFARMIRLARHVLFPDDVPSPARIIPNAEEQKALRAQLSALLPDGVDVPFFRSKVINKVLIFNILDSLLGTIFPELKRRSPEQLKEKLIIIRQANVEAQGSGGIRTGSLPSSRPLSIHSPMSMSMINPLA